MSNLKPSVEDDGDWLTINGGDFSQFKNSNDWIEGSEIWLVIEWKDGNVIRVPLLDDRVIERNDYDVGLEEYVTFSVDLCSGFYQDKYMTKNIHFDKK